MESNKWGCSLKIRHFPVWAAVGVLLLTLGRFPELALGDPQAQGGKQIEVKLIPKRKSIRAGNVLQVRVEIWNVGSKPFFLQKAIYELCVLAPLSLRLELGPPMKPQPGHACAADCIYDAKDSFARRLAYDWTILPPQDFYGTVVTMDPDTFPQLKTPGRWRLRGTYNSLRDLSSSFCFDTAPIPDKQEQINGLPFKAWEGTVETNTVWIEVLRAVQR